MRFIGIAIIACLVAACGGQEDAIAPEPKVAAPKQITATPTREAYFGDMHVHTSWSTDAYAAGNRIGPADAYRFARGEVVKLPSGVETQLSKPLDFVALTDHAEGFDAIGACTDSDHPLYDSSACTAMRAPGNRQADYLKLAFQRGTARPAQRSPDLCEEPSVCINAAMTTWERVQAVANEFNDPGNFTALIGYEFSSLLPSFGMLHRNVIFRGEDVIPHAISSMDVAGQADFFEQLDAACQEPCEVLTIPHNTNYSWGLTFSRTDEDGSAYDDADIARRARIDRLAEITQQKGNSECQIGVGFSDEDCDFGNLFPACEEDAFGQCATEQSFVRNALIQGIEMQNKGATNLFKFGLIGSTDNHNSDPGNTNPQVPSRNARAVANKEAVEQIFATEHIVAGPFRKMNIGGLAAVWADANTRDAIYDGLKRRETFATSGSRMRIRFFAGDVQTDNPTIEDLYRTAVPMGSDLTHASPDFWVQAIRDPDTSPLDRIQIVKAWVENGEPQQRVWDVACADDRLPDADGKCSDTAVTVDTETCTTAQDLGAAELSARFNDPTFNKDQHAFYYARVFENPTCRWTTWLANSANTEPPNDVEPITQQRGWSSPIWILP
ncbi:MAG: DUF3604 domain-containing protein [Pseudomonadales bacterium]|nr:DUF3604 domain-containing protein [Pseudomonadales bacterium]